MDKRCAFSQSLIGYGSEEIKLNPGTKSIVVECPECGSIRTVHIPQNQRQFIAGPVYPNHSRLSTKSTNIKPHWKRVVVSLPDERKWIWQETEEEQ